MPNWATNTIRFDGEQSLIDSIAAAIQPADTGGNDVTLDFDLLIPMPEGLRNTVSPTKVFDTAEDADKFGGITREAHAARVTEYGAANWYDWRLRCWGCKWTGSSVTILDRTPGTLIIQFDTPWSAPGALLDALAERGATITGACVEPGVLSEPEKLGEVELFDDYFVMEAVEHTDDPEDPWTEYRIEPRIEPETSASWHPVTAAFDAAAREAPYVTRDDPRRERFIVFLVAGYGADDTVETALEAAGGALNLTRNEGRSGTQWYVFDRETGTGQIIEQHQIE